MIITMCKTILGVRVPRDGKEEDFVHQLDPS